jgi:hypothetical protein
LGYEKAGRRVPTSEGEAKRSIGVMECRSNAEMGLMGCACQADLGTLPTPLKSHKLRPKRLFFPCDQTGKTVFAGLMKTFRLTIVVVASALLLASANAMPDLGRETGRFIRNDQSTPKDVRTFEPAKPKESRANLSFALPFRPAKGIV